MMRIDIEGVIIDAKSEDGILTIFVQQNGATISLINVDLSKNIKNATDNRLPKGSY